MKRWALGLFGTSAIIGLGWLGVAWSQHRTGSQDPPLPDLTKAPVNADAASWADNQTRVPSGGDPTTTGNVVAVASGNRTPSDPFQGVSQSAADLNSPSVNGVATATEAPASKQLVGDRYANDPRYGVTQAAATEQQPLNAEPQRLSSDPAAQPIAPDPTANRNAPAESVPPTDYRNTPVDYRNQSPDNSQSTAIRRQRVADCDRRSSRPGDVESGSKSIQLCADLQQRSIAPAKCTGDRNRSVHGATPESFAHRRDRESDPAGNDARS